MSNVIEFYTITSKRGPRSYYWPARASRWMPIKHAEALFLEAAGQARRVEKPAYGLGF